MEKGYDQAVPCPHSPPAPSFDPKLHHFLGTSSHHRWQIPFIQDQFSLGEIIFHSKIFPSWIQNGTGSCLTHISPQNFFMLTGCLAGMMPRGDPRTPTPSPGVSPSPSQGHGGHGSHKWEVSGHLSGNEMVSKGSKRDPRGQKGLGEPHKRP